MALDDRLRLPLGLFPGAGVAATPQELRAAAEQEFRGYRGQRRREAIDERESSSNRVRNAIFDKLSETGLAPEWAGRGASIADFLPGVGDVSSGEDTYQAAREGDWKMAALAGTATAIGVLPILGDLGSGALKTAARTVPIDELRAAARSGEEVAPVFRGVADLPPLRERFHTDMLRGKAGQGPWGAAVDVRATPDAYAGERMFGTNEGSRFSISPSGEINSVVKQVDEPNKALAKEALGTAKRHGGRWLSVFDTAVAEKYADAGFRPVKRMKFADEYAPEGWDYDKFADYNGGRPDVVFMEYDPEYKGGYKAGGDAGEYVDDYDVATGELTARAAAAEDPLTLGKRVLERRAEHLTVPRPKRPKADPDLLQMDTSPSGYRRTLPEQKEVPTPRLPEGAKYPQNDRIRPLIDKQDAVATRLAEKMKPVMGGSPEFFYHTGPVVEAAERAGMNPIEARTQFNRFADYFAATSPRTKTEDNLRNASLAFWKETQGVPITEVLGDVKVSPDTGLPLMGERGYPMMLGSSGIHGARLAELAGGGTGPEMLTNPKPFTFAENVKGNLQGATVDTHAIRGALQALNEIEPGAIPEEWLVPGARAAYKADPSSLDPANMIDDKLKVISTKGAKSQPEYGVLSDLYAKAGKKIGVDPAVAQSLGWFGSGGETGLGSDIKTMAELFDERVAVTAKELGMEPEEVLVKSLRGQMPLLGLGGIGVLPLLNQMIGPKEDRKGKT